jgi:hypothetical protein
MLQRRKLDKLRDRAKTIATRRARSVRSTACVGLELEEILHLVELAVSPENYPILASIAEQIADYAARTPQKDGGFPDVHGFMDWTIQLHRGVSSLPTEIPKSWLTAWRDGYEAESGWDKLPWSPRPLNRCEDCRLTLPNVGPDGSFEGDRFQSCPACGGRRISGICFYDMRKFSLDGGKTDTF